MYISTLVKNSRNRPRKETVDTLPHTVSRLSMHMSITEFLFQRNFNRPIFKIFKKKLIPGKISWFRFGIDCEQSVFVRENPTSDKKSRKYAMRNFALRSRAILLSRSTLGKERDCSQSSFGNNCPFRGHRTHLPSYIHKGIKFYI